MHQSEPKAQGTDGAEVAAPADALWIVQSEFVIKAEEEMLITQERWSADLNMRFCMLDFYRQTENVPALVQNIGQTAHLLTKKQLEEVGRLVAYGDYYARNNRLSQAIDVYKHIVQPFPGNVPLLFNLASALQVAGNLDESIFYLKQAHGVEPNDLRIMGKLVEQSIFQGDLPSARHLMEQVLNQDLARTSCYFDLAVLSMTESTGKASEAWARYLEWHEAYPDNEVRINIAFKGK